MTDSEIERMTQVRLFPDYAESVIWFSGPLSYEAARITPQLADMLNTWDSSYYASLTDRHSFKSADLARAFTAEGTRLADLLADEIGPDFEVEFTSYEEGAATVLVRSDRAAQNPDAAKAFNDIADAHFDQERRFMENRTELGRLRLVQTKDGKRSP